MARYTMEQTLARFELEQLLMDYCEILDIQGGTAAMHLFDPDLEFAVGKLQYRGHDAMRAFYEGGKKAQAGAPRTGRHLATNVRISFEGDGATKASIKTIFILFSGAGTAPLVDATVPTIVSDAQLDCRLDADGQWRIYGFYGSVIFVGDDPVAKKNLVG